MAGVNKVILLGNLGRDPELSYTPGGMAVCKFSIATSRKKSDGTELTAWHRLTAFGKQAEIIAQYVNKGQQLYVEGELTYGQYEKDGIVRYTTDIIVREFSLIGGRGTQQQGYDNQGMAPQQNYQQRQAPQQQRPFNSQPQQNYQQQAPQSFPEDNFSFTPPDDDIPF